MNKPWNVIVERLGLSKAIAFNTVARAIQGVGGVVTVFLVAKFLSQEEQGYYYTFGSILSIQIFIELGLGGIITQFVAHEYAFLKDNCQYSTTEMNPHLSRLGSLTHFFAKWYLFASVILLVLLAVVGFVFFQEYSVSENIEWEIPWLILIGTTSISLLLSPLFAFFEGIGKVEEVAFIRLITQSTSILSVWFTLICGGRLYALSLSGLINLVVTFILLNKYHGLFNYFLRVFRTKTNNRVDYFNEIFPYQWRIAISWISGYFIFQLFNPILFAFCGPKTAGHMGMTLTVLNGILNLTLSWTTTNVPFWSSMIALKEYVKLDISFHKVLRASSLVCLIGNLIFLSFMICLKVLEIPLYYRFLPFRLTTLLCITIILNNIINAWATYLRCHKKEPFLIQAVIVGLFCSLSTYIMAKFTGVEGVVVGYTGVVCFISFPLSYYIFKTKKLQYNV